MASSNQDRINSKSHLWSSEGTVEALIYLNILWYLNEGRKDTTDKQLIHYIHKCKATGRISSDERIQRWVTLEMGWILCEAKDIDDYKPYPCETILQMMGTKAVELGIEDPAEFEEWRNSRE